MNGLSYLPKLLSLSSWFSKRERKQKGIMTVGQSTIQISSESSILFPERLKSSMLKTSIHRPVLPVTTKFSQAASLYPALAICSSKTGKAAV